MNYKLNEYTTEYIIPYGQTVVGKGEFTDCHDLEKLYVPAYVTQIDESNFVERKPGKALWKVERYQPYLVIYGEEGTEAEECARRAGVRFIKADRLVKGNCLCAYFGSKEKVEISEGVDTIGYETFKYAPQVVSVEIPNTVKYIESEAFMGCELKEVRIPFGVQGIGSGVFKNCKNLQCVVFENGDTKLDNDCFSGCSDTLVVKAPAGGYVEKYAQQYQVKFESF